MNIDININFDLNEYLNNLVKALGKEFKDRLGTMTVFKAYPVDNIEIKDIPVPAVLVDFKGILPSEDENKSSTGQLAITFIMEAYVIIDVSEPQANLKIRQHAMNVAGLIHNEEKFGSPVTPAEILSISPRYEVTDENQNYLAWCIEWQHKTYLASQQIDVLCDDPEVDAADIDKVFLGHDPKTGIPHKRDYTKVYPNE